MELIDADKHWKDALQIFLQSPEIYTEIITPYLAQTIKRYANIAQAMASFYSELHAGNKSTVFPDAQMQNLINVADAI